MSFLKHFVDRWTADTRPWARIQLINYLHGSLNHPGHEVVFKHVFRNTLQNDDHELLVHFMVVLDSMVRRVRRESTTYNWRERTTYRRKYLFARPNKTPSLFYKTSSRKVVFQTIRPYELNHPSNQLFSQRTRAFMRRRIWRYFRLLSFKDPNDYVRRVIQAFALYRDNSFVSGEAILDNWSLMHAAFFHSEQLRFTDSHANLVVGGSIKALKPAPYQVEAWRTDTAGEGLWGLLTQARSQLIRFWTIEMIRTHHKERMEAASLEDLVQLLSHRDPTVCRFAIDLFKTHASLATLPMSTWLRIVEEADVSVLPTVCDAMRQHIDPSRFQDEQLIDLTLVKPSTVATFGFELLKQRHHDLPIDADRLVRLSECQCEARAELIAQWALQTTRNERSIHSQSGCRIF